MFCDNFQNGQFQGYVHVCVCIYIHTYIFKCFGVILKTGDIKGICTCMSVYIYIYNMYIYVYICIYLCINIHVYIYRFFGAILKTGDIKGIYTCMSVYIYIYIYMCIYIYNAGFLG